MDLRTKWVVASMTTALSAMALGCPTPAVVDAGSDAGADARMEDAPPVSDAPALPVRCADTTTRVVFPSPGWQTDRAITVPPGDMVASFLRPGWSRDVARIEGFPRRPVLVVPLSIRPAEGATFDASRITAVGRTGSGPFLPLSTRFEAQVQGDGVVVRSLDAFPRDVDEVLIGVASQPGGLEVVPACDAAGAPDATYATWASMWPTGTAPALVTRLGLARSGAMLEALDTRLHTTPVLEVASMETLARAAIPAEDAPDAATAAAIRFPVASGVLRLPDYRDGMNPMTAAADGAPMARGTTEPAVLVALPSTGTAPYPVVLFQHGGGQSPRELFHVARRLAEQGFAFVAIDLPEHGHRAPASGGSDLSFLNFDAPIYTRENFRQAVADHLAVITGLNALSTRVGTTLGVPSPLDGSRVFYMGLSLGGISGSITSQVSTDLDGAAVFVAAAGFPELLSGGLFSALLARELRRPQPMPWAVLGVGATILDGADPLAYAGQTDSLAAPPLPVLQFHAIGDPLIVDEASELWARAFGSQLALPSHHPVASLTTRALPFSGNFTRGGQSTTRAYIQCPMAELTPAQRHGGLIRTDYAQSLVAHCFSTDVSTGSCEVIDTGFAMH
jgi:hypothetical protein